MPTLSDSRRRTLLISGLAAVAIVVTVVATLASISLIDNNGFHFQRNGALQRAATPTQSVPTPHPVSTNDPIADENAQPGTDAWQIAYSNLASVEIQAYANATAAQGGDSLTIFVSTETMRDTYSADVYRLGWYGGKGGRLLKSLTGIGQAQGYYNAQTHQIVACPTCVMDPATKMIEANWRPSFQLAIPTDWLSGAYMIKLTEQNSGKETMVPFVVRSTRPTTYLATIPDLTTAAYNDWGGYSLYHGPDNRLATRAYKVSLNRPSTIFRTSWLPTIITAIRWLERQGYDVSYISNLDLHEHPDQLLAHHAYLSLGHDEYWSKAMRDGVERARDVGVGLAFFGANAGYWQVRLDPDHTGKADRIITCYKSALLDPLLGKDNSHVTVEWRQPPVNRPENALVGIMYGGYDIPPDGYPWYVSPTAKSPLLANTGLKPGQHYGCNLVGYEWDGVHDNGMTPKGLTILATTFTTSHEGYASESNTTYYIARSGAFVFATGSIYWANALDDLRLWDVPSLPNKPCFTNQQQSVPGMQQLMANVMAQLIVLHPTSSL
jgi:hypothetical protein